jgi:hypothetical protein
MPRRRMTARIGAGRLSEELAQPAFELTSFLHVANALFVMYQDPIAIDRTRRGFANRLRAAGF